MRCLYFLVACAGLSACGDLTLPVPSLSGSGGENETIVTRDKVTLVGPHGFCVDPQSSRRGTASAFVVFGNCRAINGSQTAPQPRTNAVVTSTVRLADPSVPKISQSADQLSTFFDSNVGHILLSRGNDPTSVKILESGPAANGAYFIYIEDSSEGAPEGTANTYWRAYLDVQNSVVTLSVLSLDANPLSRREGLEIMRGFTSKIRSAETRAVADAVEVKDTDVTKPKQASGNRPILRPNINGSEASETPRKGLLQRLFG